MMSGILCLAMCLNAVPGRQALVEPPGGQTIDLKIGKKVLLPEQKVAGDTGINVLLDQAHQAWFQAMWELPPLMMRSGFRVVTSFATLDSTLDPNGKCRIRVPNGNRRPFAWVPNPKYNVAIVAQHDPNAQGYLPEEIEELKKFVKGGGGLILSGAPVGDAQKLAVYPLNKVAQAFDASLTTETVAYNGRQAPVLSLGRDWRADREAEGKPVVGLRKYGKGYVILSGAPNLMGWVDNAPAGSPASQAKVMAELKRLILLAAQGKKPVGGSTRLPMADEGVGGPVYPEMEERVAGAVVYYAKNQFPKVLDTVRVDMKKLDEMVRNWTPSPAPKDPMFLILAAGYGGGWAVNIYEPKEVGIIAPDPDAILSILAHEVAHTCYAGPTNDQGRAAGQLPEVFSEAHAGWFQRKGDTWRNPDNKGHEPNDLFSFDPDGTKLDLSNSDSYPYGQAWTKLWWLWQKLDEKYGPEWYPRWLWVKNMRWAATPSKNLTWDEVVEDMSIACGEDLFPFMNKIGTTLSKERFASANFDGKTLNLPVAEIPMGKCGRAIVRKIGDFKKPLR